MRKVPDDCRSRPLHASGDHDQGLSSVYFGIFVQRDVEGYPGAVEVIPDESVRVILGEVLKRDLQDLQEQLRDMERRIVGNERIAKGPDRHGYLPSTVSTGS